MSNRNIGFCKGYIDGYEEGVYENPYDGFEEAFLHLQYKEGYDAGVADYCRDYLDK